MVPLYFLVAFLFGYFLENHVTISCQSEKLLYLSHRELVYFFLIGPKILKSHHKSKSQQVKRITAVLDSSYKVFCLTCVFNKSQLLRYSLWTWQYLLKLLTVKGKITHFFFWLLCMNSVPEALLPIVCCLFPWHLFFQRQTPAFPPRRGRRLWQGSFGGGVGSVADQLSDNSGN